MKHHQIVLLTTLAPGCTSGSLCAALVNMTVGSSIMGNGGDHPGPSVLPTVQYCRSRWPKVGKLASITFIRLWPRFYDFSRFVRLGKASIRLFLPALLAKDSDVRIVDRPSRTNTSDLSFVLIEPVHGLQNKHVFRSQCTVYSRSLVFHALVLRSDLIFGGTSIDDSAYSHAT